MTLVVDGGAGLRSGPGVGQRFDVATEPPGYEGREEAGQPERLARPARLVNRMATGFQFLIGLGATLLGILALLGIASVILVMTSVLIVGLAELS